MTTSLEVTAVDTAHSHRDTERPVTGKRSRLEQFVDEETLVAGAARSAGENLSLGIFR